MFCLSIVEIDLNVNIAYNGVGGVRMTQKIAIVTDSTSGLSFEEAKQYGITIIPLKLIVDTTAYTEMVDITYETFFEALTSGKSVSTSQPAVGDVMDVFESLLKTHDHIIYITISSLLSGTYQAGCLAAQEFDNKVTVIDSLTIARPLKNYAIQMTEMAKDGLSPDEIYAYIELFKSDQIILLMPETLTYLKRGGRIDAKTAMIGNLLGIKPILKVQDGTVQAHSKVRATNKGIQQMVDYITEHANPDTHEYFAIHIHNDEAIQKAKLKLEEAIHESIPVDDLPPVIATHAGPGTIALGYNRKYVKK